MDTYGDVKVSVGPRFVATVEIRRPPNNYFDEHVIASLAAAMEALDTDARCRAVVLCSEGRHFCAGAAFDPSADSTRGPGDANHIAGSNDEAGSNDKAGSNDEAGSNHIAGSLYAEAVRLFGTRTPVVAAVQGAAIGGGLGVACFADFRVGAPEARLSANFARLGFHHGFGLSVTLPAIVGQQNALDMLYTGRRVKGEEAAEMGLLDRLVPLDSLRAEATAFAEEIAASAPLAVDSIRQTMRGDLAERVRVATEHELAEQTRLQQTSDFAEGIRAAAQRSTPVFTGE